jgi:hypothetical protein
MKKLIIAALLAMGTQAFATSFDQGPKEDYNFVCGVIGASFDTDSMHVRDHYKSAEITSDDNYYVPQQDPVHMLARGMSYAMYQQSVASKISWFSAAESGDSTDRFMPQLAYLGMKLWGLRDIKGSNTNYIDGTCLVVGLSWEIGSDLKNPVAPEKMLNNLKELLTTATYAKSTVFMADYPVFENKINPWQMIFDQTYKNFFVSSNYNAVAYDMNTKLHDWAANELPKTVPGAKVVFVDAWKDYTPTPIDNFHPDNRSVNCAAHRFTKAIYANMDSPTQGKRLDYVVEADKDGIPFFEKFAKFCPAEETGPQTK